MILHFLVPRTEIPTAAESNERGLRPAASRRPERVTLRPGGSRPRSRSQGVWVAPGRPRACAAGLPCGRAGSATRLDVRLGPRPRAGAGGCVSTRPALATSTPQQPILDWRQVHGFAVPFDLARGARRDRSRYSPNSEHGCSAPPAALPRARRSLARIRASSSPTPNGLVR